MELSRVLIGAVVTEKAERAKLAKSYTLTVAADATKIDVKNALKRFYDIDVVSIRVMRTPKKTRLIGRGSEMVKRRPTKKAIVTLGAKSKPLDLASFTS